MDAASNHKFGSHNLPKTCLGFFSAKLYEKGVILRTVKNEIEILICAISYNLIFASPVISGGPTTFYNYSD
tara:strand:- start:71 stop:283 length:213 start_codon:yes stop_codon:yes gene_type:complete